MREGFVLVLSSFIFVTTLVAPSQGFINAQNVQATFFSNAQCNQTQRTGQLTLVEGTDIVYSSSIINPPPIRIKAFFNIWSSPSLYFHVYFQDKYVSLLGDGDCISVPAEFQQLGFWQLHFVNNVAVFAIWPMFSTFEILPPDQNQTYTGFGVDCLIVDGQKWQYRTFVRLNPMVVISVRFSPVCGADVENTDVVWRTFPFGQDLTQFFVGSFWDTTLSYINGVPPLPPPLPPVSPSHPSGDGENDNNKSVTTKPWFISVMVSLGVCVIFIVTYVLVRRPCCFGGDGSQSNRYQRQESNLVTLT